MPGDEKTSTPPDEAPALRVGRALDNDVVVPDRRVSRYHLEAQQHGHVWRVQDLGSGNGTELNGQSVQAADARVGDVLRIGSTLLRLTTSGIELVDDAPALAASPTWMSPAAVGEASGPLNGGVDNGRRPAHADISAPTVHTQGFTTHRDRGSDSPAPKKTRPAMKTVGAIAAIVLALIVGAGVATAVANATKADEPSAARAADPSAQSDVPERNDAAAADEGDTPVSTTQTWSSGPGAPDLDSQARDLWYALTFDERDLACNAYYADGPAVVRLALTSSGYADTVVLELLGIMESEFCEPVNYEYEYEYEYEVVPPAPSIPGTGGALPPPPPPAWSGPNYSPTVPSTPPSLSSDNFGW